MKGTHLLATLRHRYEFCMIPQCIDEEDVIIAFLWSTCEGVLCPNRVGTPLVPEALRLQRKHQWILSSVSTCIDNSNPYQQPGKTDTPEKYMCYISHTEVKMPSQRWHHHQSSSELWVTLRHLHMPQSRDFTPAKRDHVTEVADV